MAAPGMPTTCTRQAHRAACRDPVFDWENRQDFEEETDVLVSNWPVFGRSEVRTFLGQQCDGIRYTHDQTLRLMSHGYVPSEIAEAIEFPPSLARLWHLRGYYGTLKHNVRGIYAYYLGWYDGNPATLDPPPPREMARSEVSTADRGGPSLPGHESCRSVRPSAATHDARPASDPARVPGARLVELSVRLHVDGIARAERDQLQVSSDPIDDPETPHPIAAEALEFVAERLAGAGILEKRLECGPNLAFEHRMKAANQCRDLVRNSQTAWRRHPVVFRRLYSNSSSSV